MTDAILLQVCVIRRDSIDNDWQKPQLQVLQPFEHTDDLRLVFTLTHRRRDIDLDWRAFVNGEPDTWVYAEATVVT